jgi:hypothetical protein
MGSTDPIPLRGVGRILADTGQNDRTSGKSLRATKLRMLASNLDNHLNIRIKKGEWQDCLP